MVENLMLALDSVEATGRLIATFREELQAVVFICEPPLSAEQVILLSRFRPRCQSNKTALMGTANTCGQHPCVECVHV